MTGLVGSLSVGLLLAAGAGRRMGRPKALVHDADGTSWLVRSVETLLAGGCDRVTVVLGARADEARVLMQDGVAAGVDVVVADDWDQGMSASLRAGLAALAGSEQGDVAVVTLVDLPDVGPEVVARVLAAGSVPGRSALVRATYDGRPGHPVLFGRDHWAGVVGAATGDRGARDYLADRDVLTVECGDLATGHDQDTPVA